MSSGVARPIPKWDEIGLPDSDSREAANFAVNRPNDTLAVTTLLRAWNQILAPEFGKIYALSFQGSRPNEAELFYQAFVLKKSNGEKQLLSIKSYN